MRRLLLAILAFCLTSTAARADDFFDQPRSGANCFNGQPPDAAYFEAARDAELEFLRLTWSKWPSVADGAGEGWFLQGDPDKYNGLIAEDLATLRRVLDDADAAGMKVMLVPLSLPGLLWRQHNGDESDPRLWQDLKFHQQAAALWRDLAEAVGDHPAVVGYNLVNEPHPARTLAGEGTDPAAFAREHAGTAADLNALYDTVIHAIREVDANKPIVLDGGNFAGVGGLAALTPVADDLGPTLYAFHFYEPWAFTSWRAHQGEWTYPSVMPLPWGEGDTAVDAGFIEAKFALVDAWQREHGVPADRMLLGEYGIQRRVGGAAEYLRDVRAAAARRGWHHAFYAFREDAWPMMDYEYGTQFPPKERHDNPLWQAITGRD